MQAIVDNTSAQRFELALDGDVAFIDYRRNGHVVALTHAQVPRRFEGKGVGSTLTRLVLDALRTNGDKVLPRCSFVVAYMHRHPETHDLLAEDIDAPRGSGD